MHQTSATGGRMLVKIQTSQNVHQDFILMRTDQGQIFLQNKVHNNLNRLYFQHWHGQNHHLQRRHRVITATTTAAIITEA